MTDDTLALATIDRDSPKGRQLLGRELGVSSFGCNLLVLEGELTLLIEGAEHVLGREQLVRVGPAARRQLINAGPDRLVLLALGASGEHAARDGLAWESWDDDSPGRPPLEVPMPDDLPG